MKNKLKTKCWVHIISAKYLQQGVGILNKKLFKIILITTILVVAVIQIGRNLDSGLSQDEYEKKVNQLSNGEMKLENIRVKKGKAIEETFTADVNEKLFIMNLVNDQKIESMLLSNKAFDSEMNEIDIGKFAKYADVLIQIAEPGLSEKDRTDLLNNQLQFESIVFSGEENEKHTETKNASYTFIYGGNSYNFGIKFKK